MEARLFLAWVLAVVGGLVLASSTAMLVFPQGTRAALRAFPRCRPAGWILAAAAVGWVTWIVRNAELGRFAFLSPYVPLAGILLFVAVVWGLDKLLPARALGGLLLLVADPLLDGIRWSGGAWNVVVTLMIYLWIALGAYWMLYPWGFRKLVERLPEAPSWFRALALLRALAGVILCIGAGWIFMHA